MKFYDCKTAPSPRLVRIFIAEKGVNVPTQEVDLRNREHLTPAFRDINPYCTVPALLLDDGTCLTSTQACWRYLEEAFPEPPLMGTTPKEKALVVDRLWHLEMDGFQAIAEAFRNSSPGFKDRALIGPKNFEQIPALAERGKIRVRHFLDGLDEQLEKSPYLAGDRYTAADIMALVLVDFAARLEFKLAESANAARQWYADVSARPSAKQ